MENKISEPTDDIVSEPRLDDLPDTIADNTPNDSIKALMKNCKHWMHGRPNFTRSIVKNIANEKLDLNYNGEVQRSHRHPNRVAKAT
jgi:hypothetical protein